MLTVAYINIGGEMKVEAMSPCLHSRKHGLHHYHGRHRMMLLSKARLYFEFNILRQC
jgi:hypothetical protein